MNTDPVATRTSQDAYTRACQALDELILVALVHGPQLDPEAAR